MTDDPRLDLVDLRDGRRPDLLPGFVRLYDQAFTDPADREDPAAWTERLRDPSLRRGTPFTHLVVAAPGEASPGEVWGGLLSEYYPGSACGLLAYLVVSPERRRRGIARRLLGETRRLLVGDAARGGAILRAVFAEAENPALVPAAASAMPPAERLLLFDHLGMCWVDLPYVQPALSGGGERSRHLLLLVAVPGGSLDGAVVREFLHEFYCSLGIADPLIDSDFLRMSALLQGPAPLRRPGEAIPRG